MGPQRPLKSPNATKPEVVSRIVYLRSHYHFGPCQSSPCVIIPNMYGFYPNSVQHVHYRGRDGAGPASRTRGRASR